MSRARGPGAAAPALLVLRRRRHGPRPAARGHGAARPGAAAGRRGRDPRRRCATRPQLDRLPETGLCHGTAGLLHAAWRMAADATQPRDQRGAPPAGRPPGRSAQPGRRPAPNCSTAPRERRSHCTPPAPAPPRHRTGTPSSPWPDQHGGSLMNDARPWHQVNITFPDWDQRRADRAGPPRPAALCRRGGRTDRCLVVHPQTPLLARALPGPPPAPGPGPHRAAPRRAGRQPGTSRAGPGPSTSPRSTPSAARGHGRRPPLLPPRQLLPAGLPRSDAAGRHGHRREISLMLCSVLMRAAGQDWYEQGDVWARVASSPRTARWPRPERARRARQPCAG